MKRSTKTPEKKWHRIVSKLGPFFCKVEPVLTLERHNEMARERGMEEYEALDMLGDEDAHALDMLEWEKEESMKLLRAILKEVAGGHYNDTIIKGLKALVEIEFRDDPAREELLKMLGKATPRTFCGGVESWALAAMQSFATQRMTQLNSKEEIYKAINARFPKAKCPECGGQGFLHDGGTVWPCPTCKPAEAEAASKRAEEDAKRGEEQG